MKRILIIKIGAIGDIVMALPTITDIKRKYPQSHITWVCGNIVAGLLNHIDDIDEVVKVDERKIFQGGKFAALTEIAAYQKKVAFKHFDLLINFHHDKRYKVFGLLINAAKRLHLNRDGERPGLIPGRSRSFEHLRLFLQHDDNYAGELTFPSDAIPNYALGQENQNNNLIILAPGGAKNTLNTQELRRWPIENYVEVARYLISKGYRVAITGIQSDSWVLPYFDNLPINNMIAQLSIVELVAFMRSSTLVLTHDSGPYHLAVLAQRCKVIALFGPTNPYEFTYGPGFPNVKTLWKGKSLLCSPCYFGKLFSTQCKNNICMQMIETQDVLNEINLLLDAQ